MTEREALKIALDALKTLMIERGSIYDKAITAIKEALAQSEHGWTPERIAGMARLKDAQNKKLAQPEHEPVAWYRDEDGIRIYYETKCWDDAIPLYTAPQPWEKFCDSNCVWTDHHPDCKLAQRTWVGLTDEEIQYCVELKNPEAIAEEVEAKLKEKNT